LEFGIDFGLEWVQDGFSLSRQLSCNAKILPNIPSI
jgi:hypothetical protein